MALIVKPIRPGTNIKFVGETQPQIAPSFSEVVAVPIIHDWGPINEVQQVNSFSEFVALYGDSDTEGRTAIAGAFNGQGLDGVGGAGGVLVYRMAVVADAEKATKTLQNTTPANAITFTAKYEGERGNLIAFTVIADPSDNTRNILKVLFDGAVVEQYIHAKTNMNALAAAVNEKSNYVTAAVVLSGVALGLVTASAMTGGDNGDTLTGTEWAAAWDALEFKQFSLLAPYNLTDDTILAGLKTWVQTQEAANRPVIAVTGGADDDDLSDAITRAASFNDPHFVTLGIGQYHDDLVDKDLSTAQLAPRIAGILAAKGDEHALTFSKLAGLTAVGDSGPTSEEIESAILNGVTVISNATSAVADLKIEKGLTTFTTTNDAARPQEIFSDIRLVRIMDIYIRNMKQWGDDIVIGNLPVNDNTRATVRGEARRLQADLENRGLIIPGTSFVNVDEPTDPALADSIPYDFGWQFARTANYLFGNGRIK